MAVNLTVFTDGQTKLNATNLNPTNRQVEQNFEDITNLSDVVVKQSEEIDNRYNKQEVDKKISDLLLESGNVTFRNITSGEIFELDETVNPPVTTYGNIVVSKSSINISEGESDTFSVKLDKSPTNNQIVTLSKNNTDVTLSSYSITFTPSNWNTVQNITVSVSEDGDTVDETCLITLSSQHVSSKTVTINISDNDTEPPVNKPVQSITLNKASHTFKVGEKVQLTPIFTPTDATNKNVTWSSNNSNCTVDLSGVVTAKIQGNSVITCTTEDGNKTATCEVTVLENSTPPSDIISEGLILNYNMNGNNGRIWTNSTSYGNDLSLSANCVWGEDGVQLGSSNNAGTCTLTEDVKQLLGGDMTYEFVVDNVAYTGNNTILTFEKDTIIMAENYGFIKGNVAFVNGVSHSNIGFTFAEPYITSSKMTLSVVINSVVGSVHYYVNGVNKGVANKYGDFNGFITKNSINIGHVKAKALRFYNRCLSAEEILSNFQNTR